MATHAPWGAGNDPPQALPGGIIISLDFYILFCQQIADSYDKFRLDSDLGLLTFLVVFDSYFSIPVRPAAVEPPHELHSPMVIYTFRSDFYIFH
jgi:hypothetical protein